MVSRTLSSPIPNDPTDWVTDTQFYERESTYYAPRGRVRPEAEQIAYKNRTGTVARLFSAAEPRTPRYKRECLSARKCTSRRVYGTVLIYILFNAQPLLQLHYFSCC